MLLLKIYNGLFEETCMLIKIQQDVTAGSTFDSDYIKTNNQQFKFPKFYRIYKLKCHKEILIFALENSLHQREQINELVYLFEQ